MYELISRLRGQQGSGKGASVTVFRSSLFCVRCKGAERAEARHRGLGGKRTAHANSAANFWHPKHSTPSGNAAAGHPQPNVLNRPGPTLAWISVLASCSRLRSSLERTVSALFTCGRGSSAVACDGERPATTGLELAVQLAAKVGCALHRQTQQRDGRGGLQVGDSSTARLPPHLAVLAGLARLCQLQLLLQLLQHTTKQRNAASYQPSSMHKLRAPHVLPQCAAMTSTRCRLPAHALAHAANKNTLNPLSTQAGSRGRPAPLLSCFSSHQSPPGWPPASPAASPSGPGAPWAPTAGGCTEWPPGGREGRQRGRRWAGGRGRGRAGVQAAHASGAGRQAVQAATA